MKIKDLDRNEIYDLTEIKKDAVKFDMLKEWLEKNCHKWTESKSMRLHIWDSLMYNLTHEMWYMLNGEPTKCALTLFDLDITDYQVDCSELSNEQISKLGIIFKSKGYKLISTTDALDIYNEYKYFRTYYNDFGIFENNLNKVTITYDKFIELFGEKAVELSLNREKKELLENIDNQIKALEENQGYKETQGKCNYELDFDFIRDLAMRIQNEPKYEPYNWQKPMNVEQLSNAMLRHAIEVKKGNFDDNGELGHLLALAANAMFIYYQKKNNEL